MGERRVIGVGIDLAEAGRLREAVERHGERFLLRLFGAAAPERSDAGTLARAFAVKEACLKAIGTGWGSGVAFSDVEWDGGAVRLRGLALEHARQRGGTSIRVAVHEAEGLALAVAVLLDDPSPNAAASGADAT